MSCITLEKDNPFPGNLARPPALALAGDGRAVLALSITPKRSLAMLVVPGLWLLHWLVVSRQEAVDRRQMAEGRGQKAEGRRQTAEGRGQTAEGSKQ
ncbi:MAG: hypothetical protein Q7U34_09495 [Anaerolineales bacterium]|nr:hypothetical protein [Anaerolineales bacterium]